jgi:glucose 1-dehydrogenase
MEGLRDKVVLVTGGTSGIGQAIAVRFAAEGAHVAINYREHIQSAQATDEKVHQALEKCVEDVKAHGVNHILVQGDVTVEDEVIAMVDRVSNELGTLDILINNAGIQVEDPTDKTSLKEFRQVVDVDLTGAFIAAREAIRHFLAAGKAGQIINISSVHQLIPKPGFISYSLSKGGMRNLTRTLALEYAREGIRVNAVAPGATMTPMNNSWVDDPQKREQVQKHIPLGRAARAEEMAAVTAFLASDEAAYITGQTLFVDGGLTLYPDFLTPWSTE